MTATTDTGLPAATRRALAAVTVAVVALCTLVVPAAGPALVGGVALAWALVRIAESSRRALLGGAVLPPAVLGAFGSIYLLGGAVDEGVVGLSCLLAGACLAALFTRDGVKTRRLVSGLLLGTILGFGAAAAALVVVDGSVISDAETVEANATHLRLFVTTAIAAGSLAAAVGAAPLTLYGRGRDDASRRRNVLLTALALLFGACWLVIAVARYAVVVGPVIDRVLFSFEFQITVWAVAFGGSWLAMLAFLTRMAWYSPDEEVTTRNTAVGLLLGMTAGFTVLGAGYVLAEAGESTGVSLSVVFGGIAVGIGCCFLASSPLETLQSRTRSLPAVVLAVALGIAGISLGATLDGGPGAVATGRGLATLLLIGAGLFGYAATRRGVALTAEVTTAGATRRAQFVALGWVGALVVAGLVIAVVGLGVGAVLTPALPATATGAVVLGLAALSAVGWSLLQ